MPEHQYNEFLPISYNESKIKLLVRDPKCIFAYWEISDEDKKSIVNILDKDIIKRSIPVLKVNNISGNKYFFVEINEFACSWYISVEDAGSIYNVEIGRKINDYFISILSSNYCQTPSNSLSNNTNTLFADCRDLTKGYIAEKMIFNINNFNPDKIILGLSSQELMNLKYKFVKSSDANIYYGVDWDELIYKT